MLAILRTSQQPLGAYVIARKSRALGAPLAPNQVYRILARLRGRVRRVEALNAYFEDDGALPAIAICRSCRRVQALDIEFGDYIPGIGRQTGFRVSRTIMEVHGTCRDCT